MLQAKAKPPKAKPKAKPKPAKPPASPKAKQRGALGVQSKPGWPME